jgi:hypothetical protein
MTEPKENARDDEPTPHVSEWYDGDQESAHREPSGDEVEWPLRPVYELRIVRWGAAGVEEMDECMPMVAERNMREIIGDHLGSLCPGDFLQIQITREK